MPQGDRRDYEDIIREYPDVSSLERHFQANYRPLPDGSGYHAIHFYTPDQSRVIRIRNGHPHYENNAGFFDYAKWCRCQDDPALPRFYAIVGDPHHYIIEVELLDRMEGEFYNWRERPAGYWELQEKIRTSPIGRRILEVTGEPDELVPDNMLRRGSQLVYYDMAKG